MHFFGRVPSSLLGGIEPGSSRSEDQRSIGYATKPLMKMLVFPIFIYVIYTYYSSSSDVDGYSKIGFWTKSLELHKIICITDNFSLLIIDIPSDEYPFPPRFCPFFGHFRSFGPNITSLATAREVMLGPWTGNARKPGKISAEMDIHSSVMTMIRTLKLSVIQLTIVPITLIF